ncbi:hypothetical protein E2C01_096029 [Portunus trituberculatus]|nr:hypothetical protein [Portunus trituberculatus]
MRKQYS